MVDDTSVEGPLAAWRRQKGWLIGLGIATVVFTLGCDCVWLLTLPADGMVTVQ